VSSIFSKILSRKETVGVSPIKGSFDLSGGVFKRAERIRRVLLAMVVLTLAGASALIGAGFVYSAQSQASLSAAEVLQAQNLNLQEQLGVLDSAGSFTSTQITEHLVPRQEKYVQAVTNEVDVVSVIQKIQDAAGTNVRVTGLRFTPAETPAAPQADGETTEPDQVAGPSLVQATLTASGATAVISDFEKSVLTIAGITRSGETSFASGDDGITTITVTLNVALDLLTPRAAELPFLNREGVRDQFIEPVTAAEQSQATEPTAVVNEEQP
jgi:hypothetical protein